MTEVVDLGCICFASNIFCALERITYGMGHAKVMFLRLHREDFDGKTRVGLWVATS